MTGHSGVQLERVQNVLYFRAEKPIRITPENKQRKQLNISSLLFIPLCQINSKTWFTFRVCSLNIGLASQDVLSQKLWQE